MTQIQMPPWPTCTLVNTTTLFSRVRFLRFLSQAVIKEMSPPYFNGSQESQAL